MQAAGAGGRGQAAGTLTQGLSRSSRESFEKVKEKKKAKTHIWKLACAGTWRHVSAFTHHLFRPDPGTHSLLCLELACPQRARQSRAEQVRSQPLNRILEDPRERAAVWGLEGQSKAGRGGVRGVGFWVTQERRGVRILF